MYAARPCLRLPVKSNLKTNLSRRVGTSATRTTDVIVVGGGHNGLVAAALLTKQGLKVNVFEEKDMVGGACKTEYPFEKAPGLGTSTGAYLLGVMPPELMDILDIKIPTIRRDPHYFLPTTGDRYLLFGSDKARMKEQFLKFFSQADWDANDRLQAEMSEIREDIGPTWLQAPLSIEETAEKFVRPNLRDAFVSLCREPVSSYIDKFEFKSDLIKAMYAVTDGFSGLNGSWDSPGTGMNFLVHNMCRLPGSDGTWMVVKGGMGKVTQTLAGRAMENGAIIQTGCGIESIRIDNGIAKGVVLKNGVEIDAKCVVVNADPFRLRDLAGGLDAFPDDLNRKLDSLQKDGTTFKVNLALSDLPKFKCLETPNPSVFHTTTHILPDEDVVMESLSQGFRDVQEGKLPEFPSIEWYIHTSVDPSLQDDRGNHNSALFVQWVPYELQGTSWENEEDKYVEHLLSICDRYAPGTSDLVVDTFPLTPPKIEKHFGITHGHIHHIDNSFGFSDRFPYATPIAGLYSCSAGCHPAGSVIGCAGHNAAVQVVKDLGLKPSW